MPNKNLEEKLEQVMQELKFKGFKVDAKIKEKILQHVEAYINLENWNVNVSIDSKIDKSIAKLPEELFKEKDDLIKDLMYAVTNHEFGHNRAPDGFFGCPGDEKYFKKIIEGIRDALAEFKVPDARKNQMAPQIANLFEDYIVNSSYSLKDKKRESFKRGISSFYALNSLLQNGSYSQLYGTFVDIQFKTFWREGEIRDYAQNATQKYSPELAKDLIKIMTGKELTDKILRNEVTREEELEIYDELNDKEKWNLKAYEFTKKIYHLLDEQEKQQQQQQGGGQSQGGGGGQQSQGGGGNKGNQEENGDEQEQQEGQGGGGQEEDEKQQKQQGKGGNEKGKEEEEKQKQQGKGRGQGAEEEDEQERQGQQGNGTPQMPKNDYFTEKYQKDKTFRDKINGEADGDEEDGQEQGTPSQGGRGKYQKQKPQKSTGRTFIGGRGVGMPNQNANYSPLQIQYKKLYDFYESIAQEICITPKKEGEDEATTIPITHMQKKRIENLREVTMDDVAWEATMPLPNGEWSFFAKDAPIVVEDENGTQYGSTKDICFIGDVSGSMGYTGYAIAQAQQTKLTRQHLQGHDNFLVMMHSVIKDLKKKEMAYHLKYSTILFSNRTEFSGWHTYYQLDDLLQKAYNGYQGGGTGFNANVLKNMHSQSHDKFLTIMLSDGAIWNAAEASRIVGEIIKQGNEFVLIEYQAWGEGQLTEFGQHIKKMGGDVHVISNINDLFKITLDKTREMYK